MPKAKELWNWPRLEVYLPNEQVRRRVKMVAASQDKKVSDYCLDAILERLEHDEGHAAAGPVTLAAELRAWQQQLRTRLGAKRIPESSGVIRRLRKDRVGGLTGLR